MFRHDVTPLVSWYGGGWSVGVPNADQNNSIAVTQSWFNSCIARYASIENPDPAKDSHFPYRLDLRTLGWFPLPESLARRLKLANCCLMHCQLKPHIPMLETSSQWE
jgi:hypothetical protein